MYDLAQNKAKMAAILGTIPNNQVGTSHRNQEREPNPWEFGAPVNQEVGLRLSLPTLVYSSLSLPCDVYWNMCL